ncbi:MAG: Gfo/Idh/MocA family protein [Bacteroidota bacterium]
MVRFGLIGCGRVARYHAEALSRLAGASLVAVCDIQPERCGEFAARYGAQAYTDYRALLERDDLDVVNIATPSGDHPLIGAEVARAGKHVLIEKPLGLTLREMDELIATCRDQRVKLGVVHQNRFNPAVRKVKEALEAGRFGRLSHASVAVRWHRDMDYYVQAPWRGTWAQDGGVLLNQSVHAVDIFRWLMGQPETIAAVTATRFHSIEAEDVATAAVRFQSGALGSLEASNNVFPANWEETIAIFGDRGSAAIGGVALNRIERWEFADAAPGEAEAVSQPDPPSVYGHGHERLLAEVVQAVENDRPFPVSGEEGRAAVEFILGIYRSQETGQPVTLPLRDESARIAAARGGRAHA